MDIPLCRWGTLYIFGLFGFFSFFLACSLWGVPALAEVSEGGALETSLAFHEDIPAFESGTTSLAPSCEAETVPKAGESEEDFRFRMLLATTLQGEPMEGMVPFLTQRDRKTAAFLVSIARKESSWGEHAPTKDGIDCYNYWGYKGEGSRGTGMGYACFASPEEAIETVGDRLAELVHEKHLDSPERLIVWKCGSSCEGHSPESVAKWIADVKGVYSRFF